MKLTNEQIVKRLYKGDSRSEIARELGCDRGVIHARLKRHLGYNLTTKIVIENLGIIIEGLCEDNGVVNSNIDYLLEHYEITKD